MAERPLGTVLITGGASGIGAATAVRSIDVRWPGSGTVQRVDGPIAADARYELREDRAGLKALGPPRGVVALSSTGR